MFQIMCDGDKVYSLLGSFIFITRWYDNKIVIYYYEKRYFQCCLNRFIFHAYLAACSLRVSKGY